MKLVLDAWAILAYLQREEPAASRVKEVFTEAEPRQAHLFISIINLGEVYYRIGKTRGEQEADETLEELRHLPLTVLPADEEAVLKAARLKIHYPLSYADAFAASAAKTLNAPLLTGDPELGQLQGIIPIEMLQRH